MNKKIKRFLALLFVLLANILVTLGSLVLPFLAIFNRKLRLFLVNRAWDATKVEQLRRARNQKERCVVFFCSSAGEYEQARPLASRILEDSRVYVHFLFFSQSGYSFASLRKESIPYSLAPLDTINNWKHVFRDLRPDVFMIVRHELWPSCLFVAQQNCPVLLVNASLSSKGKVGLFAKSLLLLFVSKIYTVSESERLAFIGEFPDLNLVVQAVGDSKYDRVMERLAASKSEGALPSRSGSVPSRLVVGSAWKRDCEIALAAFSRFRHELRTVAQLVLVPHEPSIELVAWIESECERLALSSSKLSQIGSLTSLPDVIIGDTVGILFELYGSCDIAFVGGALHNKVHNVLEPVAFGIPVAFGPFYKNSHEACELVENGLATIVHSEEEFFKWMTPLLQQPSKDQALRKFLIEKSGATDRLLKEIVSELEPAAFLDQAEVQQL